MIVDFSTMSPKGIYHTMIQTLVPRPVAWVLSDSGNASYNVAPFSYFMPIASQPPLVAISVGHKPSGERKDTWRNIAERDVFVAHIASREFVEKVTESSRTLPHGVSELERIGLRTVPFADFELPRLEGPRVAFACRRHRIIEIGDLPQGLVIGDVERVFVDDAAVREERGRLFVDAQIIDPISRLGGDEYGLMGDVIAVPRPR